VSRATGIPVETLRTWEQRYGFPVPERKPSGHRVYATSVVPRLRRVAEALARGHRASDAVPASDAELSDLLSATPATAGAGTVAVAVAAHEPQLQALLEAVSHFDAESLRQVLLGEWARLGPTAFLDACVGPLVRAVGDAWSDGALHVRHEHFLSERLGDLLRVLRLPFDERADGPAMVLATLPGEPHAIGLQMAALSAATAGARVFYLGAQTPPDQIAAAAADVSARAVALSVSLATSGAATRRALVQVRSRLAPRVELVVGGEGAPAAVDRVQVLASFAELAAWVRRL
jgi:methanogenic corrinoid protein MtbC1